MTSPELVQALEQDQNLPPANSFVSMLQPPEKFIGSQQTARLAVEQAFVAGIETLAGFVRRRDSDTLHSLLARIEVGRDGITMDCRCRALAPDADSGYGTESRVVSFRSGVRLTRSGRALRLVHDGDAPTADRMDLPLVRLIVKAHRWWKILRDDPVDIKTLSARENVSASWMTTACLQRITS